MIAAGTRILMQEWPFEGDDSPVLAYFDLQNQGGEHVGSALGCWERLPEGVYLTVLDPHNPEDAEPGEWSAAS